MTKRKVSKPVTLLFVAAVTCILLVKVNSDNIVAELKATAIVSFDDVSVN